MVTTETDENAIAKPAISGRRAACEILRKMLPADPPKDCATLITQAAGVPDEVWVMNKWRPDATGMATIL